MESPLILPYKIPPRLKSLLINLTILTNKIIGHGSYGYVVEAMDTRTNTICAIKKISHLFSNLWDSKRVLREITLLRKFKSKRIIKIYDIIVDVLIFLKTQTLY